MHFSLVKINPPEAEPTHGVDDAMLPMFFALQELGYKVETRINTPNSASTNIVFGSCRAPRKVGRTLPKGSIVYNLEQFHTRATPWNNQDYLTHMRAFPVWDYSAGNSHFLRQHGIDPILVPLGYVPQMTRLAPALEQDIDVLFYGLLNERRHTVLQQILAKGVRLLAVQNAFGAARDQVIQRAKLVLNIHYYAPASLEVVRLGYLWANKKTVVSEIHPEGNYPTEYTASCAYYRYEDITQGVMDLLESKGKRTAQAEAGFNAFARCSLVDTLQAVVGRRIHAMGNNKGHPSSGTWPVWQVVE